MIDKVLIKSHAVYKICKVDIFALFNSLDSRWSSTLHFFLFLSIMYSDPNPSSYKLELTVVIRE